ncbi:MAG: homoaconitate hydratase [Candidatus Bathyarchaeum sp.]|nr:MAG: homoaconitate hydratase [Candidatus Bathyarchaeum sp.]
MRKGRLNEVEEEYLNEQGQKLLKRLKREGILPSPYNFANFKVPSLDEYIVHDSTLREGEQTPGVIFSIKDKLTIAKKLDEVGIQQIEAGFPAASEKQRKCIESLVDMNLDAQLSAFARAKKEDIDLVANTGADGIVLSLSISPYHRKYKFHGMSQEEYLEKLADHISYAEDYGLFVIYSAEDTTRENDLNFLKKAYKTAEEVGADRARIIDTLGCASPNGMAFLVKEIGKVIDIPIEVHCHNDLGLALANSLASVEAGASTVSTSVNGLGERAGITVTEEVIPALHIIFGTSPFEMSQLTALSKLVEEVSGIKMPPQKPLTGENVTAHSSGIHQHGVFVHPTTYEFYPPRLVGQRRKVFIDELGGRHGILYVAKKELGLDISEETARKVLERVKASFYHEGRRSSYTPNEIKELILEIQRG